MVDALLGNQLQNKQQNSYKNILQSSTPYLDPHELNRLRNIGNSSHAQGHSKRQHAYQNQNKAAKSSTLRSSNNQSAQSLSRKSNILTRKSVNNLNRMTKRSVQRLIETLQYSGQGSDTRSIVGGADTSGVMSVQGFASGQTYAAQKNNKMLLKHMRSKTPGTKLLLTSGTLTPADSASKQSTFKLKGPMSVKRCEVPHSMCLTQTFKADLCKVHFLEKLQKTLRQQIRKVYKDPESAFAAFNFRGQPKIGLQEILDSRLVKTSGYEVADVKSYLLRDRVFLSETSEIDFMQFKKYFFPQLMMIEDSAENALLKQEEGNLETFTDGGKDGRNHLKYDSARNISDKNLQKIRQLQKDKQNNDQEKYVRDRLKKITLFLREKFQNTWVSVRKAFLDLDVDKDGEISPEDIMRFFGDANNLFDYFDLVKILQDLDSKRQGTINYNDFCKWMGGAIHKSEGFYFRHDSHKNPPYEANLTKVAANEKATKTAASLMSHEDILKQLAKKFETQWKTLQSAFKQLNLGKSGKIQKWELKFFTNHWGFVTSDEQFDRVFNTFDVDGDGEISYQDLQKAFGSVLNPPENFYFRQDLKKKPMTNVCQTPGCSFTPIGYSTQCTMHNKQIRMKAMSILGHIKEKLGDRWDEFTQSLKNQARDQMGTETNADGISVDFSFFTDLLKQTYRVVLTDIEQDILLKAFSAKSEIQNSQKLSLKPIFQLRNHEQLTSTYKKVQYSLDDFHETAEVDTAGYFGTDHRINEIHSQSFTPLNDFNVILRVIADDYQLVKIMQTIRSIDTDKNGFVTNQELEDILKLTYKKQLQKYDLKPALKSFASQTNRLLINYSKFKEAIVKKIRRQEGFSSQGALTDRDTGRKTTTMSPYLTRRQHSINAESPAGGKAAGVSSAQREFTTFDALNGYENFLGQDKDQKLKGKKSLADNLSPPHLDKKNRNYMRFNSLSNCADKSKVQQNDRRLDPKAQYNSTQHKLYTNETNAYKLSSQQETFGILRKHVMKQQSLKQMQTKVDELQHSGSRSVSGLSQLAFFNRRQETTSSASITQSIKFNQQREASLDATSLKDSLAQMKDNLRASSKESREQSESRQQVAVRRIAASHNQQNKIQIRSQLGNKSHVSLAPHNFKRGPDKSQSPGQKLSDGLRISISRDNITGEFKIPVTEGHRAKKSYAAQQKAKPMMITSQLSLNSNEAYLDDIVDTVASRFSKENNSAKNFTQLRQQAVQSAYAPQQINSRDGAKSIASATSTSFRATISMDRLSSKLSYEWKNIFRGLRQQETFPKGQGLVTKATLQQVLDDNHVKLTLHEFKQLSHLFQEETARGEPVVNFERMSKELGLHTKKVAMIQPSLFHPAKGLAAETRSFMGASHYKNGSASAAAFRKTTMGLQRKHAGTPTLL